MYINEAVRKALSQKKYIARKLMADIGIKIQPTNSLDCCVISKTDKSPAPRWQPSAEDLVADDWSVVD